MRLASVLHQGAPHAARLTDGGESDVLLDPPDVGALLGDPAGLRTAAGAGGKEVAVDGLTFQALTRPAKVVCVGVCACVVNTTGA